MSSLWSHVRQTWRALLLPRRALPILLVGLPLVGAQWWFTRSPTATASGLAMFLAFIALAPAAWRLLFPLDRRAPGPAALRVLLYAGLAGVVLLLTAHGVPGLYRVPVSFLTSDPSMAIVFALFCVGGWGLGRDIDLERRALRLQRDRDRAELLAIRAQLDPHFLFNTLNALAEWTREDPATAERGILQLADMLRTVLSGIRSERWTLGEELDLVQDLLDLHRLRDPSRFTLRQEGRELAAGVTVPPMLLLPLAENAITHGPAAGHRGELWLRLERTEQGLRLDLGNPGPYCGPRPGGQGVDMVRQRMELAYGDRARLELGADGPQRTLARLWLPLEAL